MNKLLRLLLLLAGGGAACYAQCPAISVPYTDAFSGAALSACWTPVTGPASSAAGAVQSGTFVPSSSNGYAVEMFTGLILSGDQGIQAPVTFTDGSYPALTLDQDATGAAIALEPSLNSIYELIGNSGNAPGGPLCHGSNQVNSGDTFSLKKSRSTYTATDVTTGQQICSATSTAHTGVPGIQSDWRSGTGTSSVGAVTITAAQALNNCTLASQTVLPKIPAAYSNCGLAANAVQVAVDGQKVNVDATGAPLWLQYCWGTVCSQPQAFFRNRISVQANNTWLGGNPAAGTGAGTLYALQSVRPAVMTITAADGTAMQITVPPIAGN